MKKGDSYIKKKKYDSAYEMYMESLDYNLKQENILNIKINHMVTDILNDIYKFLQNKEYVIAYELLSFIKEIAKNNNIIRNLEKIVDNRLEDGKLLSFREKIKFILGKEKEFIFDSENKSIYLGDDYAKIINSLGPPKKKIDKKKLNEEYEMLIYQIDNIKYRLFFKNKILIDVEREL